MTVDLVGRPAIEEHAAHGSPWENGGLLDGQRVQTVNVRRSSPYQKPPTLLASQKLQRAVPCWGCAPTKALFSFFSSAKAYTPC